MNNIKKCLFFVTIIVLLCVPCVTSAHLLTEWAKKYPKENAGGANQFAISEGHHINGNTVKYCWADSTVKNNFQSLIPGAVSAWNGMIAATETTTASEAHVKIWYDPDITSNTLAYVEYSGLPGHFDPPSKTAKMVIVNFANRSEVNNKMTIAHELGHLWGIDDLYTVSRNFDSIYSDSSRYTTTTRHDRNALFIGLGMPYYVNADGSVWYQKAPGIWADNEWLNICGQERYFHNKAVTTAYKVYYNANGGSGAPGYQTKIQGTDLKINGQQPSGAKSYTITYDANGGSVYPANKRVYCTFKNWNTNAAGNGTSYEKDGTYKTDAAMTLYAQWKNPKIGDLPIPTKTGYMFKGWIAGNAEQVTNTTIVTNNMTLYAQWIPATTMSLGTTYTSNINQAGQAVYYAFMPQSSGVYKIYSEGSLDTYLNLYTNTGYQLALNDDGGTNLNFSQLYWLQAGETYFFKTRLYSSSATGAFKVIINSSPCNTYSIIYNKNTSGTVAYLPNDEKKIPGVSMTLPEKEPTRNNYVFLGWDLVASNKVPTYYKVDGKFNTSFSSDANTTLYAIWGLNGDVNMDGAVKMDDAQLALKYCLNTTTLSLHQKKLMDYNKDGDLDMTDVQLIQKKALNLI